MSSLISLLALISPLAFLRLGRRRGSDLLRRLNKLRRFEIFVLAVCCFYLIAVALGLCLLRFVFAGPSSATPTATSCKFTSRLGFDYTCVGICVFPDWFALSLCVRGAFL